MTDIISYATDGNRVMAINHSHAQSHSCVAMASDSHTAKRIAAALNTQAANNEAAKIRLEREVYGT